MKKSLQTNIIIAVISFVIMTDVGCVAFNYSNYVAIDEEFTQSLAGTVVNTCTLIIDSTAMAGYIQTQQRDSEYYAVWNKLIDYKNTNDKIIKLTVVSFGNGVCSYIFDTDLSGEGAFLGDYQRMDERQEAVRELLEQGEDIEPIAYADRTDTYKRIFSSNNIPIGYVVVGISTAEMKAEQIKYLLKLSLIMSCITFLAGILLIYFMKKRVIHPINKLSNAAANYSGSLDRENRVSPLQQIEIQTGDEIERLFDSVKKMENDILTSANSLNAAIWNSHHDSMTGLYNKRFFEETLDKTVKSEDIGIIYCDIDNLKWMNDTCGHEEGDRVICQAAAFLRKYEQPEWKCFRIGGDEFVVIIYACTWENLKIIVEEMKNDEDVWLSSAALSLRCRLAIGGAHGGSCENMEMLIQEAEAQMYLNKTSHR